MKADREDSRSNQDIENSCSIGASIRESKAWQLIVIIVIISKSDKDLFGESMVEAFQDLGHVSPSSR